MTGTGAPPLPVVATAAPRRLRDTLGVRLALLLSLPLVPLVIISMLTSSAALRLERVRAEAALMGETLQSAAAEMLIIQRAEGVAEALARVVPSFLNDTPACIGLMQNVVAQSEMFSFAGYYDTTGYMECSSAGEPYDFGLTASIQRQLLTPQPEVNVNLYGPISQTSVLYAVHPVMDSNGLLIGFVQVSVPHSTLAAVRSENDFPPAALITFDQSGEILTATTGIAQAAPSLPSDRSLVSLIDQPAFSFTARSNAGTENVFSVVPLVPGRLFALGIWPASIGHVLTTFGGSSPFILPALMTIASLGVGWFASRGLVTRHILALRRSMTSFAGGNHAVGLLDYSQAPIEIQEVAEAYRRLTVTILRDEAALQETIHQKEVLLREVHHRVKNNLQLISSIMNMQMRKATTVEARVLMKSLQSRVMSLAMIHQGLYQTSGLADVNANELLADIVRQIVNLATGPGRMFDVRTSFDPIHLTPDQAVPLALMLTETVTNALKYAGGSEAALPMLDVSLKRVDATMAVLRVENTTGGDRDPTSDPLGQGTGLGTQLVEGFAQQIGGTVTRTSAEGRYVLTVEFSLRPLADAERRNWPPETQE